MLLVEYKSEDRRPKTEVRRQESEDGSILN
jgi:hypothetical protein